MTEPTPPFDHPMCSWHAPTGTAGRHRVVAAVSSGLNPFERAVAAEVFGLVRPEFGPDGYDFTIAAATAEPIQIGGGASLVAGGDLDDVASADTVIVPNASPAGASTSPAMVD